MANAPNSITHVIQGWWEGQLNITSSWPPPKPSHQVRRHSTPCDWRKTRLHGRMGPLPHPGSLAGHSWSELCDTVTPPWEITIHHQSAGREGCEEEKHQSLFHAECFKEHWQKIWCFWTYSLHNVSTCVCTSFSPPWLLEFPESITVFLYYCVFLQYCDPWMDGWCFFNSSKATMLHVHQLYSISTAVKLSIPSHKCITRWGVEPSGESPVIPSGTNFPLTSWYLVPLMEHSRNCISFSVSVPVLSVNTYSTWESEKDVIYEW